MEAIVATMGYIVATMTSKLGRQEKNKLRNKLDLIALRWISSRHD
ncbi:hypothetical protein A2U01_0098740, partial [Trifolium medium]|nr:hypothetical protein [Trifolium medium]